MTNKELRDKLSQFPDDLVVRLSVTEDYDGNDYIENIESIYVDNNTLYIDSEPYYLPEPPKEITIVKDIDGIYN